MTDETLAVAIAEIRPGLERGDYTDEAVVSQGIVMRVLAALDWPVFDTKVVRREHPIKERRKVDYALFGRLGTPSVLLEVKRVGNAAKGEKQLFEYAFHQGTRIVVLTDGRSWNLYLPGGEGRYGDRRFAAVDLQNDAPEQSAATLSRYLDHETVRSGEARKRAEADYDSSLKQRTADETLPLVWSRLVSEPSRNLIQMLGAAVETECGVRPTDESTTRFLEGLQPQTPTKPVRPRPAPPRPSPLPATPDGYGPHWLEMGRERRHFRKAADLLLAAFTELAERDPDFCERYAATYSGHKRNYLARTRETLYPGRQDFESKSAPLPGGWWMGRHMGTGAMETRIREACDVAGIVFGRDLRVHLVAKTRTTRRS